MNPEKTQELQEHIQAIANILYEETSTEQLLYPVIGGSEIDISSSRKGFR